MIYIHVEFQYILVEYLKDEVKYEKHLQEIRNDYKAKSSLPFRTIKKLYYLNLKHETPKGGMFLYGSFADKNGYFCTSTRVFKEKKFMFRETNFILIKFQMVK